MIVGLRGHRSQHWGRLLCSVAVFTFASVAAAGQQTDELQQQLQQLKQQYETTTHDLEQRITALQQEIEKEKTAREEESAKQKEESAKPKKATVSTAELAAQEVRKTGLLESDQVGAKFQGQVASE